MQFMKLLLCHATHFASAQVTLKAKFAIFRFEARSRQKQAPQRGPAEKENAEEPGVDFYCWMSFHKKKLQAQKGNSEWQMCHRSRVDEQFATGHRTPRGGILEIISAADLKSSQSKQWFRSMDADTSGSNGSSSTNRGSSSLSPQCVPPD